MSHARDIAFARLQPEEAFRQFPYNDEDDTLVRIPSGNITIGFGCNLTAGWNRELALIVLGAQLDQVERSLLIYPWYPADREPARSSVFLDMAFNNGLVGLVRGFPRMIDAARSRDWPTCSHECAVADVKLDKSRYAPLRQILLTGIVNGGAAKPAA